MAQPSLPYYSLNRFLKSHFGEPVKKIPVDAGLGCPNRDGTKGKGGCIYCDPLGSGTGLSLKGLSVEEQVKLFLKKFEGSKRFKKFLIYFQSFCNTYAPVKKLKELYDVVKIDPRIVGLCIGTRPDCVDEEVVKLLKSYQEEGYFLWVELGLQSKHDTTLNLINRGHTFADFLKGYTLLKKAGIPVVVHIIYGLPGETKEMMLETARALADLRVDGVKFHALYVVKGTKMASLYLSGKYKPLELEEYVELVAKSLTLLPPETVIHRLCSEASADQILAPLWVTKKMEVVNKIQDFMRKNQLYQGQKFLNNS